LFYFSILHHLLCLSFLPRPRYNIWCLLLKEVVLWGYSVRYCESFCVAGISPRYEHALLGFAA
jgi:hypothetical protein